MQAWCVLIHYPVYVQKEWEKLYKASVMTASLPVKIQTGYFWNKECWTLDCHIHCVCLCLSCWPQLLTKSLQSCVCAIQLQMMYHINWFVTSVAEVNLHTHWKFTPTPPWQMERWRSARVQRKRSTFIIKAVFSSRYS